MAALDFVSGANTKKMTANNLQKLRWVSVSSHCHCIFGDIFLKVRCGDCGERWRWRYHYMVSAWFIFLEHIINVKILQTLKYQQKIETTNVMPAWKCDFRSSDCHETRPKLEREEGNTMAQNVKRPEASLNCWPWHGRTLLNFEDPATVTAPLHFTHFTFYSQAMGCEV